MSYPNDLPALGLAAAPEIARVRVPAEIALVGYDDIAFAAVSFSSICQLRQQLGRGAAQLLLDESDRPGVPPGGPHRDSHGHSG